MNGAMLVEFNQVPRRRCNVPGLATEVSGSMTKMKVAGAVLALLALLAVPTEAHARPFNELDEAIYLEALAYWGVDSPPACATVAASVEALPADRRGEATKPPPDAREIACILRISDAISTCEERSVMRHEVGHLLGYGHSEDPASFMHSPSPNVFCVTEEEEATLQAQYREQLQWLDRELAVVRGQISRERPQCQRIKRMKRKEGPPPRALVICRRDLGLFRYEMRELRALRRYVASLAE